MASKPSKTRPTWDRGEAMAPTAADIHVGGRIRARRLELRLSVEHVATQIGATRGTLQRYENGALRISGGKLMELGQVLRIRPGWFFEDFGPADIPTNDAPELGMLAKRPQGLQIARALLDLPADQVNALVTIAEWMAAGHEAITKLGEFMAANKPAE